MRFLVAFTHKTPAAAEFVILCRLRRLRESGAGKAGGLVLAFGKQRRKKK